MTIMWGPVTILDGPCASSFEPLTLSHDPFVTRYFVCPRFDRRYPIPSSSSLLTNIFTRPVILQPRDLVTWLRNLYDVISPSGPRVPIRHSDGQIPFWSISYSSTYLLQNTQYALLWLPYYGVTVDTLKASSGDSDYIWSLRSKDRVTTLLSYRNVDLCDWITLQHLRWVCVHHTILLMTWLHCQRTYVSPWSGNLDHQLPNELVYLS